jgi:iron complex transport system ATP-binding protein
VSGEARTVVLEGRGLEHSYPTPGDEVRALVGVDLDLGAGDLLCVIGPNGAGKSTLVRVLGGLLVPRRGTVRLRPRRAGGATRELHELVPRERALEVAVVPQLPRALSDVRVRTFVAGGCYARLDFWGRLSPEDSRRVERALEAADVAELGDRLLDELSGGQRQRALIARAIAQDARVWLVDEPTTSLDPAHQLRVFQLLAGVAAEGRACLVVTHDLNLASQFSSAIALVDRGRLVELGTPDEVLRPEVLEPVYGRELAYGALPGPGGSAPKPFVLPWVSR